MQVSDAPKAKVQVRITHKKLKKMGRFIKKARKIACAAMVAAALLFASGTTNAETSTELKNAENELAFEGCRCEVDLELNNGFTVHLEGSCGSIRRQIRRYRRYGLI